MARTKVIHHRPSIGFEPGATGEGEEGQGGVTSIVYFCFTPNARLRLYHLRLETHACAALGEGRGALLSEVSGIRTHDWTQYRSLTISARAATVIHAKVAVFEARRDNRD